MAANDGARYLFKNSNIVRDFQIVFCLGITQILSPEIFSVSQPLFSWLSWFPVKKRGLANMQFYLSLRKSTWTNEWDFGLRWLFSFYKWWFFVFRSSGTCGFWGLKISPSPIFSSLRACSLGRSTKMQMLMFFTFLILVKMLVLMELGRKWKNKSNQFTSFCRYTGFQVACDVFLRIICLFAEIKS